MTGSFVADSSLWPLALFIAEGPQSLEAHLQMLSVWDSWLARENTFVALRLFLDEASLELHEGVGKATKAWMQSGASHHIRQHVAAMMMIVPPTAYERMKHLSVEAVFGIPGGIFDNVDDAFDWFEESSHNMDVELPTNCYPEIAMRLGLLDGLSPLVSDRWRRQ